MKILFGTNLWISFMIGRRLSSLHHEGIPIIKYAELLELLGM